MSAPQQWAAMQSVDPTLDACCQQEQTENATAAERNRILRAEAVKRGLDFAPHRRYAPAQTLGLGGGGGSVAMVAAPASASVDGRGGGSEEDDESDEDLAFLDELDAEDGGELELAELRAGRMAELRASAGAARAAAPSSELRPVFGQVALVEEGRVLQLVGSSDRVVCLLAQAAPGNAASFAATGDGTDVVLTGIQAHMQRLAAAWPGTQFVCAPVAGTDSPLMSAVRAARVLPALVCFREGVMADKATHPHQLAQFINMGEIGFTIFQAWLTQSDLLVESPRAASEMRRAGTRMLGEPVKAQRPASAWTVLDDQEDSEEEDERWRQGESRAAQAAERAAEEAALRGALGDKRAPVTPNNMPMEPGAWAVSACEQSGCRLGFSHEHLMK